MSAYNAGASTFSVQMNEELAAKTAEAAGVADQDQKVDEIKKVIAGQAQAPAPEDGLSAIVKWVPGEVIGTYAGVIVALEAGDAAVGGVEGSSGILLAMFAIFAFLLTTLGAILAFRKTQASGKMPAPKRIELLSRGILTVIGLLLWSYMIPGSVSQQSGLAQTYEAAVPLIVTLAALVFGLAAEFFLLPTSVTGIQRMFSRSDRRH